ncbi:hypothetical protein XENOCAPTIV_025565, partial [Xenoophorus captivus]
SPDGLCCRLTVPCFIQGLDDPRPVPIPVRRPTINWKEISRLEKLLVMTEGVTKSLAMRDDFVLFLFTLMTNKKTFLQTATLIEDILGVKKVSSTLCLNL